jgi:hypothetical protein
MNGPLYSRVSSGEKNKTKSLQSVFSEDNLLFAECAVRGCGGQDGTG